MKKSQNKTEKAPKKIFRVIDANLNRAREGLRVIEDTSRFVLDNMSLCRKIRRLRHSLDDTARQIYPELLKARMSRQDEGRKFVEGPRRNVNDLMAANFHRAEEALRVLEEYSKLLEINQRNWIPAKRHAGMTMKTLHADLKELRYKLYDIERTVV